MTQTMLHDNLYRPFALRLTSGFALASLLLLPPALWFGPVSLAYLGASALLGLLFAGLTLRYWKYHAHPWGRFLFVLVIAVLVIGGSLLRTWTISAPLSSRYPWWLTVQYLATILLIFSSVVFLEERVATWQRSSVGLMLLIAIVGIAWYRGEQSRPLLYPNATAVLVQDDAPPGARKVSFTTTASPQAMLNFYRSHVEQWGWQFTCSTATPSCESNITVGNDAPHDIYHRRSDSDVRGPSYEILIRSQGNGTQDVEVFDQTRGVPN